MITYAQRLLNTASQLPPEIALTIAQEDPSQPLNTPALRNACRQLLYTCRSCNQQFGWQDMEPDTNTLLCPDCYDKAGMENAHNDGHHTTQSNPDCHYCTAEGRV